MAKKKSAKTSGATKTPTAPKRGKEVKRLEATVATLEARLDRAETKAARWKAKAKDARSGAAAAEKRVAGLEKELTVRSAPAPEPAVQLAVQPDASWTVARLRAEARERGLAGMSAKNKAELLAALGG